MTLCWTPSWVDVEFRWASSWDELISIWKKVWRAGWVQKFPFNRRLLSTHQEPLVELGWIERRFEMTWRRVRLNSAPIWDYLTSSLFDKLFVVWVDVKLSWCPVEMALWVDVEMTWADATLSRRRVEIDCVELCTVEKRWFLLMSSLVDVEFSWRRVEMTSSLVDVEFGWRRASPVLHCVDHDDTLTALRQNENKQR